ncbi:unnamed protein product, partial [Ilex paraguariensis]
MWMMSYNDGAEFNMTDSFNGRKLRTLIPRPSTAASPNTATANSPYLSHIHGTDVLALRCYFLPSYVNTKDNHK